MKLMELSASYQKPNTSIPIPNKQHKGYRYRLRGMALSAGSIFITPDGLIPVWTTKPRMRYIGDPALSLAAEP